MKPHKYAYHHVNNKIYEYYPTVAELLPEIYLTVAFPA